MWHLALFYVKQQETARNSKNRQETARNGRKKQTIARNGKAAGANPSWWSSSNRQNSPIQQKCYNFWTSNAILMPFEIQKLLKNCNIVYFMRSSSSTTRAWRRCKYIFRNHEFLTHLINDKAVCRAVPGFARVT